MAREKFTIRLSEAEKAAYEEHREEHTDIDSLSAWLRTLADREVDSPPDDDTSALDEALLRSIIRDETRGIRDQLDKATDTLASLDEAVRTGEKTTHFAEEAYRILSGIEPEDTDIYTREVDGHTANDLDIEWYVRNDGSASAFSQYFGIPEQEATRALVRCENMFPAIESRLNNKDKRIWYREGSQNEQPWQEAHDGGDRQ
jgi:hypothetical protein